MAYKRNKNGMYTDSSGKTYDAAAGWAPSADGKSLVNSYTGATVTDTGSGGLEAPVESSKYGRKSGMYAGGQGAATGNGLNRGTANNVSSTVQAASAALAGTQSYDQIRQAAQANGYTLHDAGGNPYYVSSDTGKNFIASAQPGATMTGGDGTKWTVLPNGSVQVVTRDGNVFSNPPTQTSANWNTQQRQEADAVLSQIRDYPNWAYTDDSGYKAAADDAYNALHGIPDFAWNSPLWDAAVGDVAAMRNYGDYSYTDRDGYKQAYDAAMQAYLDYGPFAYDSSNGLEGNFNSTMENLLGYGPFAYDDSEGLKARRLEYLDQIAGRDPFAYDDSEGLKQTAADKWDALNNYGEFSYDPAGDQLYQNYRRQYLREGERARQNALAEAAAQTGGMASTAAIAAASQANDYYNARLTDKIPELEQQAYGRYIDQYNQLAQAYNLANQRYGEDWTRQYNAYGTGTGDIINLLNAANEMYGTEFANQMGAYSQNLNTLTDQYNAASGAYWNDRADQRQGWRDQLGYLGDQVALTGDRYRDDRNADMQLYNDRFNRLASTAGQSLNLAATDFGNSLQTWNANLGKAQDLYDRARDRYRADVGDSQWAHQQGYNQLTGAYDRYSDRADSELANQWSGIYNTQDMSQQRYNNYWAENDRTYNRDQAERQWAWDEDARKYEREQDALAREDAARQLEWDREKFYADLAEEQRQFDLSRTGGYGSGGGGSNYSGGGGSRGGSGGSTATKTTTATKKNESPSKAAQASAQAAVYRGDPSNIKSTDTWLNSGKDPTANPNKNRKSTDTFLNSGNRTGTPNPSTKPATVVNATNKNQTNSNLKDAAKEVSQAPDRSSQAYKDFISSVDKGHVPTDAEAKKFQLTDKERQDLAKRAKKAKEKAANDRAKDIRSMRW